MFPTVQEVLQADWHAAWQFPQPPVSKLAFKLYLLSVLTRDKAFLSFITAAGTQQHPWAPAIPSFSNDLISCQSPIGFF